MEDTPSLGSCCGCGAIGPTVRNIYAMNIKAPEEGKGWACLACGLPPNGATAVLCDACHENGGEIKWICIGYPAANERIPYDKTAPPFDHDRLFHPELWTWHVKHSDQCSVCEADLEEEQVPILVWNETADHMLLICPTCEDLGALTRLAGPDLAL